MVVNEIEEENIQYIQHKNHQQHLNILYTNTQLKQTQLIKLLYKNKPKPQIRAETVLAFVALERLTKEEAAPDLQDVMLGAARLAQMNLTTLTGHTRIRLNRQYCSCR